MADQRAKQIREVFAADHRYYVEILRRGQGERGGSCGPTLGYVAGQTEAEALGAARAWAEEHGSDLHRFAHDPECPACDSACPLAEEVP